MCGTTHVSLGKHSRLPTQTVQAFQSWRKTAKVKFCQDTVDWNHVDMCKDHCGLSLSEKIVFSNGKITPECWKKSKKWKKRNLQTQKSKNTTGFMGPYAYCQGLKCYN